MAKRHSKGRDTRGAVRRIEELVLASSGEDAFEVVVALVAARLHATRAAREAAPRAAGVDRARLARALGGAAKAWPWLGIARKLDVPDDVLGEIERLLDQALGAEHEGLDAVFEQLVTRVGKGDKGQFFTPRHVVELAVRALGLVRGERVVDPACGSGAFLAHARAHADVETWGADVDPRAVRIAKLLALATGADPDARVRADSLADPSVWPGSIDVIATNPPFAGDVARDGFELGALVPRAERDAFVLERAITMLRPGGRIAIVLPHGKTGAPAWAPLRQWLVERARVFAVVSLAKETFLPHTSQRAVLLFAKKRARPEAAPSARARERVLFAVSERAGKDAGGEPVFRASSRMGASAASAASPRDGGWRALDHDLDEIAARLTRFFAREGFS